ncbi:MAG: aldo/keto reductase [Alkalispirochaeta sp.]
MNYRNLGKTGMKVSEVSLGTWQVGGGWGGEFDHAAAETIINSAIDAGVNFIDTADVYDDGLSEAAVGSVVRSRSEEVFVASKCGRQLSPHVDESYTPKALRGFVEASLKNTGLDRLDLIQLHCPPTQVYYRPEIFELFDRLKEEGKIANLGVSVEKVEEAEKAIQYDNVSTVQMIFNMFRHRPRERFFQDATARGVGVIIRVPLASGLLSGKFTRDTTFDKNDHRTFNRDGAAFDKGETFSGVPYDTALDAVDELRAVLPTNGSMAQSAVRWILDHPAVSTVIPGASRTEQVTANCAVSELPPLTQETHQAVNRVYDSRIRPVVHHRW